jgi:hypothetical protein
MRELQIKVVVDTRQAKPELAQVEQGLKKVTSAATDTSAKVATASSNLVKGVTAAGTAATVSGKAFTGMGQAGATAAQSVSLAGRATEAAGRAATVAGASFTKMFGAFALGEIAGQAITRLAANVTGLLIEGARMSELERSFTRLTGSVGEMDSAMLKAARQGTRGLVADMELMQAANKAILLGLPVTAKEMRTLASTAVTLGKAMGQDATKSLDDLITALGRSSPLILDNLGLTVKVGEANEAYAAKLGKTVSQLTDADKKTAFYNAALAAAKIKTDEIGGAASNAADRIDRLGVAWTNFWRRVGDKGGQALNAGFEAMANLGALGMVPGVPLAGDRTPNESAERLRRLRAVTGSVEIGEDISMNKAAAAAARDYVAELAAAETAVKNLSSAKRAQLDAAIKLGVADEAYLKTLGLSDAALKVYTASTKGDTAAAKDAAKAKEELKKWSENLGDKLAILNVIQGESTQLFQEATPALVAYFGEMEAGAKRLQFVQDEIAGLNNLKVDPLFQEPIAELDDYFKKIEEAGAQMKAFTDGIKGHWQDAQRGIADGFTSMLVAGASFRDGMIGIWQSIKNAIFNTLSDILHQFLGSFLGGMVGGLKSFVGGMGKALAGMLGGAGATAMGAAGGAGLGLLSGGVLPLGMGLGGGAGAGAAAGAAGGGFGAMGALMTNPWTAVAAGGIALGMGIWKGGLFRGGAESLHVNQPRDQFLAGFGASGTGEGSGFQNLAKKLTEITGEEGGGVLFRLLTQADTKDEYDRAVAGIEKKLAEAHDTNKDGLKDATTAADRLAVAFDRVIDKLDGIVSRITGIGPVLTESLAPIAAAVEQAPAAASLVTSAPSITAPDITSPDISPDIIPMASGGRGRVTRPTLFLAGEAGPEDFAFSGGGKRFSGSSGGVTIQGGISVSIQGANKNAAQLAREIAPALVKQINRLNVGGTRSKMNRGTFRPAWGT